MPWYSAHVLMRMRYRSGPPEPHYLMENIVLIEAPTPEVARTRAEDWGRTDCNEDDLSYTSDGRPAYWAFAGVRRLVDCQDEREQPTSGTELTYLEYRVDTDEDVQRLLAGEDTWVELGH